MANSKDAYQTAMLSALRLYGGAVSKAAKLLGDKDIEAGIEKEPEKAYAKWRKRHYNWMAADDAYHTAYNDLLEDLCDEMEHVLYEGANQRDHWPTAVNAANSILKARGKGRGYGTSTADVNLKGGVQVAAVIEIPSNYSDVGQSFPFDRPWEKEQD